MKFFIDTANLKEIREAHSLGLVDGVTTNPSLCAKEGISGERLLKNLSLEICELVKGPVSAEVMATDDGAMVTQAKTLAEDPRIRGGENPHDRGRPQGHPHPGGGRRSRSTSP